MRVVRALLAASVAATAFVAVAPGARGQEADLVAARERANRAAEAFSDAEITHLDGVSVDYDDWHFNVRPSNTEPLLRLNLESVVSEEHMKEKRDEVLGLIRD